MKKRIPRSLLTDRPVLPPHPNRTCQLRRPVNDVTPRGYCTCDPRIAIIVRPMQRKAFSVEVEGNPLRGPTGAQNADGRPLWRRRFFETPEAAYHAGAAWIADGGP